jgi:hypothetical protein
MFMFNGRGWEPEEAHGAMVAALRAIKSGKIPSRYKHFN